MLTFGTQAALRYQLEVNMPFFFKKKTTLSRLTHSLTRSQSRSIKGLRRGRKVQSFMRSIVPKSMYVGQTNPFPITCSFALSISLSTLPFLPSPLPILNGKHVPPALKIKLLLLNNISSSASPYIPLLIISFYVSY